MLAVTSMEIEQQVKVFMTFARLLFSCHVDLNQHLISFSQKLCKSYSVKVEGRLILPLFFLTSTICIFHEICQK